MAVFPVVEVEGEPQPEELVGEVVIGAGGVPQPELVVIAVEAGADGGGVGWACEGGAAPGMPGVSERVILNIESRMVLPILNRTVSG